MTVLDSVEQLGQVIFSDSGSTLHISTAPMRVRHLSLCSLSGTLAVLFLTLAFKSSEAVILADGYLEPSKGQNRQPEPDKEALPSLWRQGRKCEG